MEEVQEKEETNEISASASISKESEIRDVSAPLKILEPSKLGKFSNA